MPPAQKRPDACIMHHLVKQCAAAELPRIAIAPESASIVKAATMSTDSIYVKTVRSDLDFINHGNTYYSA